MLIQLNKPKLLVIRKCVLFLALFCFSFKALAESEASHEIIAKQFAVQYPNHQKDLQNIVRDANGRFIYLCLNEIEKELTSPNQATIYRASNTYLNDFRLSGLLDRDAPNRITVQPENKLSLCFKRKYSKLKLISEAEAPRTYPIDFTVLKREISRKLWQLNVSRNKSPDKWKDQQELDSFQKTFFWCETASLYKNQKKAISMFRKSDLCIKEL